LHGTPDGLKRHVALYTGVMPRLIEHFRLRRWMALGYGRLGADAALWGPEVTARLQLDAFSQIGRFVLMDTGDPLADPFGAFAHRATLVVPAADPEDERYRATIGRIVALAAPAHVEIGVRLLDQGFKLDCSAVLGTTTRLPCPPDVIRLDVTALDRPVRLAGEAGFRLGPRASGARLGAETRLLG
jgi:hypothetical protein